MEYDFDFCHFTDDGRVTSFSVNFRRAIQIEQMAEGSTWQRALVPNYADAVDFAIVVS